MVKRLFALFLLISATPALAYDEDTHFYGTYAMARYAGIKHEVAVKLALSAQWMDESYISDPTSLIMLPITGVKKRRLLHFPSSRVVGKTSAQTQQEMSLDHMAEWQKNFAESFLEFAGFKGELETLNLLTKTREGHPFATELLMEGIKKGNLMMAGASLHVLEDSYAHAGTQAEKGHADFWHWPDRPFAYMDKYQRMTRNVFDALVAIRTQLPADAVDCGFKIPGKGSACKITGKDLAEAYNANAIVKNTVSYNPLTDKEYIKTALKDLYRSATKVGYLNLSEAEFDQIVEQINIQWPMDAYAALEKVLARIVEMQFQLDSAPGATRLVFDGQKVLKDMGYLTTDAAISVMDYMATYSINAKTLKEMETEGLQIFVHGLAQDLLLWRVPIPLSDTHRFELEDDTNDIRKKEMEIRVANMQKAIESMFGTKIKFVGSNSSKFAGFVAEIRMNPAAAPTAESLKSVNGFEHVTYTLEEKHAFDHMVFHYLYPSLKAEHLDSLAGSLENLVKLEEDWKEYWAKRKRYIAERPKSWWLTTHTKLFFGLDWEYRHLFKPRTIFKVALKPMLPVLKDFLKDTIAGHLTPNEDNMVYRNPHKFADFRSKRELPLFLSSTDAWKAENLGFKPVVRLPEQ